MADLDDFFAKRDKSKKSKKSKFGATEDVAKILEQKAKDKKKLETGKSNYSETGRQSPGPGLPNADDDEWLEAEDKAPDFSNLKIQELVLTSDEEEDPSQSAVEEGETGTEGVWKKKKGEGEKDEATDPAEAPKEPVEAAPAAEAEQEKPSAEGSNEEEGAPVAERKYVPPSMRNKKPEESSSSSKYVPPSQRIPAGSAAAGIAAVAAKKNKGAAPKLDDESFPSLS